MSTPFLNFKFYSFYMYMSIEFLKFLIEKTKNLLHYPDETINIEEKDPLSSINAPYEYLYTDILIVLSSDRPLYIIEDKRLIHEQYMQKQIYQ